MNSLGDIVVRLKADTSNLEAGFKTASDKADGFGGVMSKVGGVLKVAGAALVAGGAAATTFGVLSVKAYSESQDRLTQLNAVLKSTGGIAGWTANNAIDLSKALQKVTRYSDEDVLSVENLLLTFTSISKDIMPQATETVLNMATALGEDTKSASIQLGKALQDPVLGITALRRVGVNFNDAQKEVIKNLVETGHKAEAQALILKELQTEFGNSARAAGDTFAGKLAKLKNSLNDVEEAFGKVIVNGLAPFATKALNAIASVDWEKVVNKTIDVISNLWHNYLVPFIKTIDDIGKKVVDYLKPRFEALWNSITNNLIPAFKRFSQEVLAPMASVIGTVLVYAIGLAIDAFNVIIRSISWLLQVLSPIKVIVQDLAYAFILLKAAMMIVDVIQGINAAFWTLRLITIPSLIATLTGPVGVIAAFALVAVALLNVGNHMDRGTGSAYALKRASDDLKHSQDELKDSTDKLRDSELNKEQADIDVLRAQQNYNDAVKRFGPDSLEAKQALVDLKRAHNEQADAIKDVSAKLEDNKNKLNDLKHAQDVYNQNAQAHRDQIAKTKSMVFDLNSVLDGYIDKVRRINSTPIHISSNSKIPGFASGIENFGGGMAYVHAGEVLTYLPRGSSVIPKNKVADRFGSSSKTVTTNINGPINIDSPQDADYFFNRLDRNSQIALLGGPTA